MTDSAQDTMNVIIYSDDKTVRQSIIDAVGVRPGKGLPRIAWKQTATAHAFQQEIHDNEYAVAVVDGETTKISGLVAAKTVGYEEDNIPVFVALIARPQDEWLANFSGIDYTIERPLRPLAVQETLAQALTFARSHPRKKLH